MKPPFTKGHQGICLHSFPMPFYFLTCYRFQSSYSQIIYFIYFFVWCLFLWWSYRVWLHSGLVIYFSCYYLLPLFTILLKSPGNKKKEAWVEETLACPTNVSNMWICLCISSDLSKVTQQINGGGEPWPQVAQVSYNRIYLMWWSLCVQFLEKYLAYSRCSVIFPVIVNIKDVIIWGWFKNYNIILISLYFLCMFSAAPLTFCHADRGLWLFKNILSCIIQIIEEFLRVTRCPKDNIQAPWLPLTSPVSFLTSLFIVSQVPWHISAPLHLPHHSPSFFKTQPRWYEPVLSEDPCCVHSIVFGEGTWYFPCSTYHTIQQ